MQGEQRFMIRHPTFGTLRFRQIQPRQIKNIFTSRNHTIRLRHQFCHSTRIAGEIQTRRGNAAVLAQSGKNADRKMQAVAKHDLMPAAFGEPRPFQRNGRTGRSNEDVQFVFLKRLALHR